MPQQIPATQYKVYLNGTPEPDARPLSFSYGSGAGGLASCEFVLEPVARRNGRPRLDNIDVAHFDQANVDIEIIGSGGSRWLWGGRVLARSISITPGGDSVTFRSRVEGHLLGHQPLKESYFWNPRANDAIYLDLPTVFNPDYQGRLIGNMAQKRHPVLKCGLFIAPESSQSEPAKKYAGSPKPKFWTLPEVLFYTLAVHNDSRYGGGIVANPSLADLKKSLPPDDGTLIRNLELPFGAELDELLDIICQPFDIKWHVASTGLGKYKYVFHPAGAGPLVPVKLQAAGEDVDTAKSNLEALNIQADVSNRAFNSIWVVGEYERYEASFILKKGWPKEYDDHNHQDDTTGFHDLDNNSPAWKTNSILSLVWRHWVLNEGGDYIGVREEHKEAFDFDPIFGAGQWIPRRRTFLPCLTLQEDGSPRGIGNSGVYVEWRDLAASNPNDRDWKPLDQMSPEGASIAVLDRECGIRFEGVMPPTELRGANDPQVRVTACVEGDKRCGSRIDRYGEFSLLKSRKPQFINAESKYNFRQRIKGTTEPASKFAQEPWPLTFPPPWTSEVNDNEVNKTLAEQLVDTWNTATVNGSVTLAGLDHPQAVPGGTVSAIAGRKIRLGTSPKGGKRPTVVGVSFNFQNQSTDLTLDSFRGGGI